MLRQIHRCGRIQYPLKACLYQSIGYRNLSSDGQQNEEGAKVNFVQSSWTVFKSELHKTWLELLRSSGFPIISSAAETKNSKLLLPQPSVDTPDNSKEDEGFHYRGPTMYLPNTQGWSARKRMKKRLKFAPLLDEILLSKGETNRFHMETNQGRAVREFRQNDPHFVLEEWCHSMTEHYLPLILQWILEGKVKNLKPWLGHGVFQKVAAEIKAREQEGIRLDHRILQLLHPQEWDVWAIEPQQEGQSSPTIIFHFIAEQIDCEWQGDKIVAGSDDTISTYSYVAAFQRELVDSSAIKWKIVDFRFNGPIDRIQMPRTNIHDYPDYRESMIK